MDKQIRQIDDILQEALAHHVDFSCLAEFCEWYSLIFVQPRPSEGLKSQFRCSGI